MKSRTCPNCNYTYSIKEYLEKPFWKGNLSYWKCVNCGMLLTTSTSRRLLLAFLGVAPAVLIPYIANFFIAVDLLPLLSWFTAVLLALSWVIGGV